MAKQNDAEALTEFIKLLTDHQSVMRGYIRTLLPNASDIRDVLQNTNIVLWEKRSDFKMGTNFKAWALTIARYRSLEHRKKMKKNDILVFDDDLVEILSAPPKSNHPPQLELKLIALEDCLSQLPARDHELIKARYFTNTNLEDYAPQDGRSHGALRVALNRLRIKLRDCIDKKIPLRTT